MKFAVSPEIQVGGPMLTARDLAKISEIVGEEAKIEITTFQQLIVEMKDDEQAEHAKSELLAYGLKVYEVGFVVKNVSVCNFCKGAEEEGLDVAKKLNHAIAGLKVPFPLRVGYTGCPNACGEPLVKDIGVIKRKDRFEVYIGGETKTTQADVGQLLLQDIPEHDLITIVLKVITLYQLHGKKRERFSRFVQRYGFDRLKSEQVDIFSNIL
ncbi:nitrite reductase [Fodinisporobacter ferrooxydans]|uniref:Nitrite reductase n=1 Tax=Fodinisporobacter ferrooxydans TaxID=2901836 RepID=A0ABY4CT43_9BACL|nr:nitrite reductase [Alicyclobacillaceae bacterium MYW30-H2]